MGDSGYNRRSRVWAPDRYIMGTSSSQRSTTTLEWNKVRDLYSTGSRDAVAVSSAIVSAIGATGRGQMAGEGVSACLNTLLLGAWTAEVNPDAKPLCGAQSALSAASRLRLDAERRIVVGGYASRFSDLALDAVGTTALRALAGSAPTDKLAEYWRQDKLHNLASEFLSDDIDRCFRYFVTRDIHEFVGTDAWPTINDATWLVEAVGSHCRETIKQVELQNYENQFRDAVNNFEAQAISLISQPVTQTLEKGLAAIAGG